jgi:hypothetical protein
MAKDFVSACSEQEGAAHRASWTFSAFAIRSAIKAPLPSRRFLSHYENVFSRGLGCVSAFPVLPQKSHYWGTTTYRMSSSKLLLSAGA